MTSHALSDLLALCEDLANTLEPYAPDDAAALRAGARAVARLTQDATAPALPDLDVLREGDGEDLADTPEPLDSEPLASDKASDLASTVRSVLRDATRHYFAPSYPHHTPGYW